MEQQIAAGCTPPTPQEDNKVNPSVLEIACSICRVKSAITTTRVCLAALYTDIPIALLWQPHKRFL